MDFGALASPDLEKRTNSSPPNLEKKDPDLESTAPASSTGRKSGGAKDTGHASLNFVNKSATQFKKPTNRRASPVNWFPRKKTIDSFLKRKIRHLQEVAGMNISLDETLENSNPHYSRITREKIAAQKAARKAMEARKAAMIQASWCRILRAARICTKAAEEELEKAEQCAAEAFETARTMGVMMYDRPDCPKQTCEVETSSAIGGRSTTHTVTTSFQTAFEVDKEVASAVKRAFIQLANCPSSNKEEFRDMVRKISENPETNDSEEDILRASSESETFSDQASRVEKEFIADNDAIESEEKQMRLGVLKRDVLNASSISSTELIDKMLERLKRLQEDELSSIAVIVATCGLNAALLKVQCSKEPAASSSSSMPTGSRSSNMKPPTSEFASDLGNVLVKHVSRLEREVEEARKLRESNQGQDHLETPHLLIKKEPTPEFASDLGSVLVKHVSRLEREVEEARKLRESNQGQDHQETHLLIKKEPTPEFASDLGSVLVKHVSKLEREVEEARKLRESNQDQDHQETHLLIEKAPTPEFASDLGSVLVKHVSRLKKEVEEARKLKKSKRAQDNLESFRSSDMQVAERKLSDKATLSEFTSDLGSLLVKKVSRFEKEVQEARNLNKSTFGVSNVQAAESRLSNRKAGIPESTSDLASVLRKKDKKISGALNAEKSELNSQFANSTHDAPSSSNHADNLREPFRSSQGTSSSIGAYQNKENLDSNIVKESLIEMHQATENIPQTERARIVTSSYETKNGNANTDENTYEPGGHGTDENTYEPGGHGKILVKPVCRLGKEKMQCMRKEREPGVADARQEARRQRELQEAWGGLSLDNCIRPHLSRLEREKAAWKKAEEEERSRMKKL